MNAASSSASPTATPPRQRRKQARPQELLDAALALFVERGFAATRSEAVAARAGVSKGTLYRYYPSKEELFKAVVRNSLAIHIADSASQVALHTGSSADLLRRVMGDWLCQVGQGALGGICKIMLAEAGNFPELAQFYMDEVILPTHQVLGALLRRGIDQGEFRAVPVDETVNVLIGPMLHMILFKQAFGPHQLQGPSIDPPAVLAVHLDLLLRGLCHPQAAASSSLTPPIPPLTKECSR
ncbi:TetR/AcrR family transcriptional regulator [Paucibacter sp. KCTC 42545]|uniref:TetR/AcrR family transcriptional regulator n=1 Tax=Paucibacter sp. KCTC 42545 TaxID=1768242 RepID=UPI0009E85AEA|nr:TetR/AcrR family transcriptional regulator [Paucibacter sp. KCTC 42545]